MILGVAGEHQTSVCLEVFCNIGTVGLWWPCFCRRSSALCKMIRRLHKEGDCGVLGPEQCVVVWLVPQAKKKLLRFPNLANSKGGWKWFKRSGNESWWAARDIVMSRGHEGDATWWEKICRKDTEEGGGNRRRQVGSGHSTNNSKSDYKRSIPFLVKLLALATFSIFCTFHSSKVTPPWLRKACSAQSRRGLSLPTATEGASDALNLLTRPIHLELCNLLRSTSTTVQNHAIKLPCHLSWYSRSSPGLNLQLYSSSANVLNAGWQNV